LKTLVCYRLLSPGSEWRLHREWYQRSAMGDLLGENIEGISKDKLYRCLDQLLQHRKDLFSYLTQPWKQVRDEVQVRLLQQEGELYDLARSHGRLRKERAMRQRRLKKLRSRLKELQTQNITWDTLRLKTGAAKKDVPYQSLAKIFLARQIVLERESLPRCSRKRKVKAAPHSK